MPLQYTNLRPVNSLLIESILINNGQKLVSRSATQELIFYEGILFAHCTIQGILMNEEGYAKTVYARLSQAPVTRNFHPLPML